MGIGQRMDGKMSGSIIGCYLTKDQRTKMQEYSQTCSSKNLKFTQTEMAIYIGTTQPTVSRELKRFKDI